MPVMGLQPFQQPFQQPGLARHPAFRSLALPAAPMAQDPATTGPLALPPPAAGAQNFRNDVVQMGVRRNAIRTASNARRRAAILARLQGLDPNQARVAHLGSEASISGGLSDALNQGTLEGALSDQSYGRSQANRLQDRQWMLQDRAYAADQARRAARARLIGQVGGLAGRAALGFATGGASEVARSTYSTPD